METSSSLRTKLVDSGILLELSVFGTEFERQDDPHNWFQGIQDLTCSVVSRMTIA